MARLAYIATLLMVGVALVMLDAPDLVPPIEDQIAFVTPTPAPTPTPTEAPTIAPTESPSPTPVPTPAGRDIADARVAIDRLGIDLALEWGDVERDVPRDDYAGGTPESVALVFPGSALPDAGGNTYIYSHARVGMFLSLWNVRLGDIVELRWPDATLRYEVREIHPRVDPTDTSWLDPAGPERVTLQTSTGPVPQNPRFVVIAVRIPS